MADDNRETITIQSVPFKVSPRYAAGHVLKENEASTLNQTLFENLRNNFAGRVADAKSENGDGTPLSADAVASLQQQLDDYASDYEFGVRRGGGGVRGDPVRTLAMNIAREQIRQAVKTKGLNLEDFPAQRVTTIAQQLLTQQGDDGKLMTLARQQIEAEQKAASAELEQILSA